MSQKFIVWIYMSSWFCYGVNLQICYLCRFLCIIHFPIILYFSLEKKSILLEWGWIHLESYKRKKQYHYSSWLIGHVFVISSAKRPWNWKRTRSIWHTWRFIVCIQNVGKKKKYKKLGTRFLTQSVKGIANYSFSDR